ncbi:MAG TPA: hypothetical protein PLO14_03305 [Accumulibacter sp.]|uniref:hypothetical protein n=1 Tax=Accumulibacter sp. TaxID=2053492 RepID=UPI0025F52BB9|nr:hypothetical protein [Accumulibacter sp.]MCM8599905.1 hypothetical protein [Accumulibacter sp.]MCM8664089.1 hypothetical protein [Accumulibacter sp.]HNC51256.1 hypothetical protein [Accumulibacter sp.]
MHWSDRFIGEPYVPGDADCLQLYCRVSNEVFGREIPSAAYVQRAVTALGRARQMADGVALFTAPTGHPIEGDAVLMQCRGRPSHIGAYCLVDGEPSVLHAMANAGMTVRHALRDLNRIGLAIEGFYRWA